MRSLPWVLTFAAAAVSCGSASVSHAVFPAPPAAAQAGLPGSELQVPRHPALSPDGSQVAFSHQGDVWVADVADGHARRLTAHQAYDGRPKWSPDGEWLAFGSSRHGNLDVYLIPAAGGQPERVTWNSESERLHGWLDGDSLLVGATRERRYSRRGQGAWVAHRDGRTPTLMIDAPMLRPAVSPDGRYVCYERGHGDPRRRAYRGPASSALWIYDVEAGTHRELTRFDGNDLDPMWSGDSRTVYFLSDRACDGNEGGRDLGLWSVAAAGGNPQPVFHPGGQSLREAEISRDGRAVVAELGAGLVLIGTADGEARELAVYGSLDPRLPDEREVTVSGGADELAVSPDGESIAFVADGDIFVLRKHDEIERCARVTTHPAPDSNPVWVEDGEALLFLSERDGNSEIYRVAPADEDTPFYRSRRFAEERLTSTEVDEIGLSLSPDGKLLAWIEYPGKLQVADAESREVVRVLTDGFDTPDYDWAPDSRWIAYSKVDADYNTEVYLVRTALDEGLAEDAPGVQPFNLTRHPDDDSSPRWSADGRKLVFTSRRQMLDETDVWVAWLRKGDTELTERERLEAEEAAKKAKKKDDPKKKKDPEPEPEPPADPAADPSSEPAAEPAQDPEPGQEPAAEEAADEEQDEAEDKEEEDEVEPIQIDFEDIRLRLRRLTRREGNETALGFDAGSEKVYFNSGLGTRLTSGSRGVETGFFEIDLWEGEEKQLESSSVGSFTQHDKEIYYTKGGKVVGRGGKATTYGFSVRFRRDEQALRQAVLEQGWRALDRGFYDPGFHGHDWAGSLAKWQPIAAAASTREDFDELMNWMLGEMNASHMGYYNFGGGGGGEDRSATGDLGVIWDDSFPGPGRKVREVVKGGPAHREASRLRSGEVVLAVDGESVEAGGNFYRLMDGTAGQETELTVRGVDGEERSFLIRPQAGGALRGQLYRRGADVARAKVEHASGGKLGYIHIEGMGTPSLLDFERDLYHAGAGKDALLIDVRENGGGWTTDMVLSMLMVKDHARTIPRGGGEGYPQGRRIFATWDKPVVVLCNENSYSNAEIFSWSIKTLGRGPVVGKQTYGAVISTGAAGLLDGSMVRMPMRGWFVNDGTMTNMELNGCPPDYAVENLPGDHAAEVDRQLEKAIEVGLELARSGS